MEIDHITCIPTKGNYHGVCACTGCSDVCVCVFTVPTSLFFVLEYCNQLSASRVSPLVVVVVVVNTTVQYVCGFDYESIKAQCISLASVRMFAFVSTLMFVCSVQSHLRRAVVIIGLMRRRRFMRV